MGRRSNNIIKKHEKVDEQKQKEEAESDKDIDEWMRMGNRPGEKNEHKLKEQVKSYARIVLNVRRVTNQVKLLESLLA